MKKILMILMAYTLFSAVTFAGFDFGIRAGLSSASYKADDLTQGTDYVIKKSDNSEFGYHLGVIGQFELLGLLVQPELLLSTISNKYKISEAATPQNIVTKNDRTFNLDFPIILGYKIGPAKLEAGPVGRILIANFSQLKDYTGYENQFNRASWAFQAGAGLQLLGLTVDLKYEFGLSKLGSGIKVGGVERKFDSRVNQFVLSVGYFF
jgi:hypothetical protein